MSGNSQGLPKLPNQHTQAVDLAGQQQYCLHGRGEEPVADWDPLQGGYQAIIDICDAARSKSGAWSIPLHCYEPERSLIQEFLDDTAENSRVLRRPRPSAGLERI